MPDYIEFSECFKEGDCERLKELIEKHELLQTIEYAAAYSIKQQSLSANIIRTLITTMLDEIDGYYALSLLNTLINKDKQHMVGDAVLRMIQTGIIAREAFTTQNTEKVKKSQQELIQHIGTCPDPQFDDYLSFINETGLYQILPNNITLATLERTRRRLNDDRAFFLVLYGATLAEAFEYLINSMIDTQEMVNNQFLEMGYQIEEIPDAPNIYVVHPPDKADDAIGQESPHDDEWCSSPSPHSGTEWVARQRRQSYGRRRKR